jgi:hypothetical protein
METLFGLGFERSLHELISGANQTPRLPGVNSSC